MKRTNELSRTAKPCPLERRVRYGQAPAPHSSALCARLCRVPPARGCTWAASDSEPHGFRVRAAKGLPMIYIKE